MRVNDIYTHPKFKSFINTLSFVLSIISLILVILLPQPYHKPNEIAINRTFVGTLEGNLTIAICVMVPLLFSIISFLIFKATYKKTLREVQDELDENVRFQFMDSETKFKWEYDLEHFKIAKILKQAENERKKEEIKNKIEKEREKVKKLGIKNND